MDVARLRPSRPKRDLRDPVELHVVLCPKCGLISTFDVKELAKQHSDDHRFNHSDRTEARVRTYVLK